MLRRNTATRAVLGLMWAVSGLGQGCSTTQAGDPIEALNQPSLMGKTHKDALQQLALRPMEDEEANKTLERVVSNVGYTVAVREAALDVLAERDLPRAKRALRNTLPNTTGWAWIERGSAIIAERGWIDLTPALVSSWARRSAMQNDDMKRPEYLALAELHGENRVIDVVFETFLEARSVGEQGLRTRCWDLLCRLGQRDRLVALINSSSIPPDDVMMLDLQAAARDLGVIPHNREEILWLRKLRQAQHSEFWSRAASATSALPSELRAAMEIRDLPVIVSASLHDPEMLQQTREQLYDRVDAFVRTQKHHQQDSNFEGFAGGHKERLFDFRNDVTWGDLAAMLIAIRAMQVPQVVEHFFDYAARDRKDTTTEYGGVIALDAKDRFEILEFPPVIREQDQKFIASQEMLDAAYTSIFHFHFHVQETRNEQYAGPGYGDANYADNTRANCLVLTSINENAMNVDFYRHGRVVVDLGDITRP